MGPSYEPSHAPFNAQDYVSIHNLMLADPEPIHTMGGDDAPAISEHLRTVNFEHWTGTLMSHLRTGPAEGVEQAAGK